MGYLGIPKWRYSAACDAQQMCRVDQTLVRLHGGPRNDQPVEAFVQHLVQGLVESLQVRRRGVLRVVRLHVDEGDVYLQWGVAQQAQQLGLRDDLRGHQVQHGYAQGPDVLVHGALGGHDEDVLFRQGLARGQIVRNAYRHAFA
jgi:hypothetical protein